MWQSFKHVGRFQPLQQHKFIFPMLRVDPCQVDIVLKFSFQLCSYDRDNIDLADVSRILLATSIIVLDIK